MRRLQQFFILALFCCVGATLPAEAAKKEFAIDKSHTSIGFTVSHMTISKVHGNFADFSGAVVFEEDDVTKSKVKVEIVTASINTADKKRDKHLRNKDFFHADKFPKITFESKKVVKTKDGFEVTGPLSMRGKSKQVMIPFKVLGPVTDPWGNERLGIEGGLTIDRRNWGISWSKSLDKGGLVVGNDVKISLSVEAIHKTAQVAKKDGKDKATKKK
jgi:polyisoprenoid-binding protein YceI